MSTVLQFPVKPISEPQQEACKPKQVATMEDGYTRIPNALLEAIMYHDFTKRQQKILLAVARKTLGYGKDSDWVSGSQLEEKTRLPETRARAIVRELVSMNVLFKSGREIGINMDLENWKTDQHQNSPVKSKTVPKNSTVLDSQAVPKQSHTKETLQNIKDKTPNAYALVAHVPEPVTVDQQPAEQKPAPKKPAPNTKPADPAFEQAWSAYPKREGSNPKNKALECWRARLAEGVSPEDMLAGVQRYAVFVTAKGDLGTGFVMQAKRFFGTSREFENDWAIAAPRAPKRADGRIGYVDSGFDQMNYGETEIPDWARD